MADSVGHNHNCSFNVSKFNPSGNSMAGKVPRDHGGGAPLVVPQPLRSRPGQQRGAGEGNAWAGWLTGRWSVSVHLLPGTQSVEKIIQKQKLKKTRSAALSVAVMPPIRMKNSK